MNVDKIISHELVVVVEILIISQSSSAYRVEDYLFIKDFLLIVAKKQVPVFILNIENSS